MRGMESHPFDAEGTFLVPSSFSPADRGQVWGENVWEGAIKGATSMCTLLLLLMCRR